METKAHYVLVGFFAIVVALAAAVFVWWLGQYQFRREYVEYDVVFRGPVRGLARASEVRFNGIQVGEVVTLRLDQDPRDVVARVRVYADTPLRTDSYAQLEPQGLTGLSYIQLSAGQADSPRLVPRPGVVARIPSKPAQLDQLFEGGETIVGAAAEAANRISAVLSDKNIADVSRTLENIRLVTEELRAQTAMVSEARAAVKRLEAAASEIEVAAKQFGDFSAEADKLLKGDIAKMVLDTDQASIQVDEMAKETEELVAALKGPATRFADKGLNDLTTAISDLQSLVRTLEGFVDEIETSPASFVAGDKRKEVELPR